MREEMEAAGQEKRSTRRVLLLIYCLLLCVGNCGGPLLTRLYFIHGGNHVWLPTWLESCGSPLLLLSLAISYVRGRLSQQPKPFIFIHARLIVASAGIGFLGGFIDYLYTYGVARLPLSTSALIMATQLAFTASFAFLLVRQKFTAFSINAVVLLTVGAAVLALHSSGDRPKGESTKQYVLGFVMTLGAATLYGVFLPLLELMYSKSKQRLTYTLVMQVQFVSGFSASVISTVAMLVNNDFKAMGREATGFGLGETKYYVMLVCNAVLWQTFFAGAVGVIFCASSLLSGILIAASLPITELLAVVFYRENFTAEKGVSLALCVWGFVSYFYGEYQQEVRKKKQNNATPQSEVPPTPTNSA